jgi:multiple sugar transport system substrate-binding protein/sn-glycerol 3-phosphate transport system substrate-binding protein
MMMLILLLVSAMVLSACAVPTPTQPAAEQPAAEESAAEPTAAAEEEPMGESYEGVDPNGQTVVWWHNHSGSREEGLMGLVEEFNASNEWGITIDAQNQGSYNDIRDKVNASIAAGEVPAALVVGYQNDQSFYQINDTLVDFDVLINDATYGLSEEEMADFYPSFLEVSVNPLFGNQRLGFPPNRSMEVLFYNQTWLEELGFSGPPTTPEEFKEIACAAAAEKGDGTGGYILREDASALAAWTMAFGGNVLTEDGTGYVYNGQATVDAMTFLKEMYDEGCAYLFTEGFPNPQFAARNAIFTQGSSSGIPFYQGDVETAATEQGRDPDVWGVAAIPHTTDEPVQNVYGGDIMIVKTTPEQELAAWLFVKWFTSPEVQAQWSEISGYFPTRVSASDYLSDYLAERPQYAQAVELLPYGAYEPQFVSYQAVRDQAEQAFNEMMQGADIQTTLDNLTTFANDLQASMMGELQ